MNVTKRTHLNRKSCLLFILTPIHIRQTVSTSQIGRAEQYTTSLIETTETYTTHTNSLESEKHISSLKFGLTFRVRKPQVKK